MIRQDALGPNRIYIQAKRYAAERAVGRPDIQEFVGALHGAQADRGIHITTSRFTPDANTYADRAQARVILIDGDTLAKLMVTHNIGAQIQDIYVIKRIDEDFFDSGDGNADGNLSAHQQSMTPVPGPRRLNQRPTSAVPESESRGSALVGLVRPRPPS